MPGPSRRPWRAWLGALRHPDAPASHGRARQVRPRAGEQTRAPRSNARPRRPPPTGWQGLEWFDADSLADAQRPEPDATFRPMIDMRAAALVSTGIAVAARIGDMKLAAAVTTT